jgi:chromosome segregation protein
LLKLKRVELLGFKSFCDRTELRFHGEGISAIVGPNGCGKSNLSDAISWVLGEQSAKLLRGSRMEDVIFAGTRDRKALGMAYVTMTLVDPEAREDTALKRFTSGEENGAPYLNGNHQILANGTGHKGDERQAGAPVPQPAVAPAQHPRLPGEVTITRRLYRSGESDYLIDGRNARLRDIQDIFMGTGLGPESYAIIEQGRIGQLLSSKPQDRRAIIEEAAGITKYKTRKRLAEAKLESAKQNLARVYDILEEVTRQANSLKRQASKTRRHAELKEELQSRLRIALSGRRRQIERDASKIAIDLSLASAELKTLGELVTGKEQAHEQQQGFCYGLERDLTEARQLLSEANLEAERTRGRLASQVRQSGAIEQQIQQARREAQELELRLTQLDEDLRERQKSIDAMALRVAEARERMLEIDRQREALQAKIRERERAIETARQLILRLLGEASTLQNQLAQIDEYLAGVEREAARARKEELGAAAEIERLEAARDQLSGVLSRRQLELEAVAGERQRTEEDLGAQRRRAAEMERRLNELKDEVSQIKARKESLEQILARRTHTTDTVKRLFASLENGASAGLRPLGLMADYVEVDRDFEKPAEEFLHEELEYVVVENWQEAGRGLDFVRAELDGRATFLVHPERDRARNFYLPQPAIGAEAGIIRRLGEVLRFTNGFGDHAVDLLPRVSLCFLAKDPAAAQGLALAYPHLYFLLSDGVCYHGHTVTGGTRSGAGPLALKREARELAAKLEERQSVLAEHAAGLDALRQEVLALETELERLRSMQQAREKDRVALEHEMRKLGEDLSRANSRLSVARLELDRLRRDSEKSAGQRQQNLAAVEEKERLRAQCEAALEAEQRALEALESQEHSIGEERSAVRAELAGLEERDRGERNFMARLRQQFQETADRRNAIAPEIERWSGERARLLADNIELERAAATLADRIADTEARVNRMSLEETALRESLRAAEDELKSLRGGMEQKYQLRSEMEIELVKKQADLKLLDEASRRELNCAVEDLDAGEDSALDDVALAEAEEAANEIRRRMEALGPVNPVAMEEFQEAQQRQEFLSVQRQDLIDSIRDTEKAIQEIGEVSQEKFARAFEAINAYFRAVFQTLFGGGTGEMRLTDDANLAESGIEIVCSPPGKRLQNVLLLSGGEKALAAIALLMAIFKYQPSPFCVLDEVDAPLDEANIGRLAKLLGEMSAQTQFILITHSKRTMEAAQALYGVTMQEPGVSRLVAVKLHPDEVVVTAA